MTHFAEKFSPKFSEMDTARIIFFNASKGSTFRLQEPIYAMSHLPNLQKKNNRKPLVSPPPISIMPNAWRSINLIRGACNPIRQSQWHDWGGSSIRSWFRAVVMKILQSKHVLIRHKWSFEIGLILCGWDSFLARFFLLIDECGSYFPLASLMKLMLP